MSLAGKTLFITGASRGIGLAIGLRAARDGANVAIAAKTAEPHPKLPGTIYTAAEEIERAGGKALPLVVDVRDEATVKEAIDKTAAHFGGIDIVVNNASAISADADGRDRHEALRPHAADQHARHVRRLEMGNPASAKGGQSAHPHDLAAARHEGEMVRAAHRLHDGQVRHEPGRARACRRAARQGHRRQRAVAAHRDRHRRGAEPARRRRLDAPIAQAGDHGRRRLRHLLAPVARIHRALSHRRYVPRPKTASPTSTSIASIRRRSWRRTSLCRPRSRRRRA